MNGRADETRAACCAAIRTQPWYRDEASVSQRPKRSRLNLLLSDPWPASSCPGRLGNRMQRLALLATYAKELISHEESVMQTRNRGV